MSIPCHNWRHMVGDRAMGLLVWGLRLGGVPASKTDKRAGTVASKIHTAADTATHDAPDLIEDGAA